MDDAVNNSPYRRAVMTTPPTISVSASSDATLGPSVAMVASNALTPAALNNVAFYGGVPSPALGYVAMPVSSWAPATNGNISSLVGASSPGLTTDQVAWSHAAEIVTDALKAEFCLYNSSNRKVMFQVDGQYVDFTGSTSASGSNADTYFELTFATRKVRRIRVLMSSLLTTGMTMLKAIRVSATCSFWKPNLQNVLRAGWITDSYGEGTNGSATIYPIPNAAWPVLASELLGIRDCRQLSAGGTGYLANNSGTRSTLRNQLAKFWAQAPFDLLVLGHGYNDTAQSASAVTAEALYCLQQIRAANAGVPIVVLGTQAGATGPGASTLTTEAAVAAAVASFADPLCKFAPVSTDVPTWLNGTGFSGSTNSTGNSDVYVDTDHIHPTIVGAEYLSFRTALGVRKAVASMV
jgi:hypothetical protein